MRAYKDYSWIVAGPDLLGGKLAVRDTRLSVAFLLACFAEGMVTQEIRETYGNLPEEAIAEIFRLAASQFEEPVAAA